MSVSIETLGPLFWLARSKPAMRPIAERHVARMLASAPRDCLSIFDLNFFRFEACPLMRTIAKRLAFGTAASAPPIDAWLDFLHNGPSLKDDGLCHERMG